MNKHTKQLEKAAFILKSIAHPTRLAAIDYLNKKGQASVGEICAATSCEQSLMSHHLIAMKLKGILQSQKEGTSIRYSLKEKQLCMVIQLIDQCNCNMGA
jgi:DNA-binding transcriptional ArsR family regulator